MVLTSAVGIIASIVCIYFSYKMNNGLALAGWISALLYSIIALAKSIQRVE